MGEDSHRPRPRSLDLGGCGRCLLFSIRSGFSGIVRSGWEVAAVVWASVSTFLWHIPQRAMCAWMG